MSLHKFAEQVASQGRGDDSLLVHMTPDEVRNLQQFAQANGTTLTINPTTGLPEAGLLSDLFKSIAPIALGAFLGPAGMGLTFGGLSSAMSAGIATGGITALATGSLSRGLMAGLGAYGGAGLGANLMGAGTASIGSAAEGIQGPIGSSESGFSASQAISAAPKADVLSAGFKAAAADPMGFAKNNLTNIGMAAAPIMAGAMVPTTTKMPEPKDTGYIRQFDYNINPDTGRPDPLYGMRAMTPVKASEFGNKTFQGQRDLFRQQNPNPYELGVGSLNQPPLQQPARMNTGGIVALANGGDVQHFAIGDLVKADIDKAYAAGDYGAVQKLVEQNQITAADVAGAYKGFDTSGLAGLGINLYNPAAETAYQATGSWEAAAKARDDAANAANAATWAAQNKATADANNAANTAAWNAQNQATWAAQPIQYTDAQIGAYLTDNPNVDINKAITETRADPAAVNAYIASLATPFVGSTDTTGGSGTLGIYNQMKAQGIDSGELYNAANAAATANKSTYGGWSAADIAKGYNLDKGAYALTAQIEKDKIAADPVLGYDKQWVKYMEDNKYSVDDMAQAFGISKNEIRDRIQKVKAAETKVITKDTLVGGTGNDVVLPDPFTSVVPGGTKLDTATTYDNGAYGNYGSGPATGIDYKGNTVSIATPGDIISNPDGTRTVVPNIPGRPYGGFTGMEGVKSAYTAGGGSLGYTSPVVKTAAEHNATYNKLTDDSLDAYNFLMGKGKNLSQRKPAADRPVMQRYDEAVLGRKIGRPTRTTTDKVKTVTGVPGNPQSYFNEAEYLAANPDVANEIKTGKSVSGEPTRFTSGYEHYLMYGKAGGRAFTGDYEGYLTAAALANAANASGGGGDGNTTGPSGGNNSGTVSGFTPAPADLSIPEANMNPDTSIEGLGDNAGDDAVGGYYSRGKLNYRSKDMAMGGATGYAMGGGLGSLGSYSDGGRLLKGPGDGVSDSIPATIGRKQQPARLADGEFVIPARIVSELGNGSTDAGAKKLYAMMDRVQRARGKTTGRNKVAANSRSDKYLPA